jgi:hypothetical protein
MVLSAWLKIPVQSNSWPALIQVLKHRNILALPTPATFGPGLLRLPVSPKIWKRTPPFFLLQALQVSKNGMIQWLRVTNSVLQVQKILIPPCLPYMRRDFLPHPALGDCHNGEWECTEIRTYPYRPSSPNVPGSIPLLSRLLGQFRFYLTCLRDSVSSYINKLLNMCDSETRTLSLGINFDDPSSGLYLDMHFVLTGFDLDSRVLINEFYTEFYEWSSVGVPHSYGLRYYLSPLCLGKVVPPYASDST